MKEFLTKRFYGKVLSTADRGMYGNWHSKLANAYRSILQDFSRERKQAWNRIALNNLAKEIDAPGITLDQRKIAVAECFDVLDALRKKLNENRTEGEEVKNDLKYWSVSNDFRKLGLEIPSPFEKPDNYKSGDECCSFRYWKEERANPYTVAKRVIIDLCYLAKGILEDESKADSYRDFLEQQQNYRDTVVGTQDMDYESEFGAEVDHNDITRDTLIQYFDNILRKATKLPLVLSDENKTYYATEIVEAIVPLWADINSKRYDLDFNICRNVLHLARNWMAHQKINHVDIQFAVFLFLLSMRGIFDWKVLKANGYMETETILLEKIFESSFVEYEKIEDKGGKLENLYNSLCRKVTQAAEKAKRDGVPMKKAKRDGKPMEKVKLPLARNIDPYPLVSLLGCEDNPSKKMVTAADLHKLFWLMVHFKEDLQDHKWLIQRRGWTQNDVWIPLLERTCRIVFPD